MSPRKAVRRFATGVVAVLIAAAGLVFLPSTAGVATATATPNQQVLSSINTDRQRFLDVQFATNGFLDDWAQAAATVYANCQGCANPSLPNGALWNLGSPTDTTYYYATIAGGTATGHPARFVNDVETNEHSVAFGDDFYASVGYVTKGTTSYAVFITATFSSVQTDETRPGKVTLPSSIHVGSTVTPTITAFSPLPTTDYLYTWLSNGTVVATTRTYVPQPTDLGHQLQLYVDEQNSGWSFGEAVSALSVKVGAGTPSGPSSVSVTGARNVDQTLTVGTFGYAPVTPTVQWYRNGVAIPGQTATTYLQTSSDRGRKISVKVIINTLGYSIRSWSSSGSIVTNYPLLTADAPSITGTPTFGQTLTAVPGTWGPGTPKLSYQWRSDGVAIKGATHSTLLLGTAQLNSSISVTVTGSETGFATTAHTSAGTVDVKMLQFTTANAPTITGVLTHGHVLTASVVAWSPAVSMYVYQWYLNGIAVTGAYHSTYTLPSSSVGKFVSVSIIGMRVDYQPQMHTSASVEVTS